MNRGGEKQRAGDALYKEHLANNKSQNACHSVKTSPVSTDLLRPKYSLRSAGATAVTCDLGFVPCDPVVRTAVATLL